MSDPIKASSGKAVIDQIGNALDGIGALGCLARVPTPTLDAIEAFVVSMAESKGLYAS